ncbi:murein L,D-transpeptidase YafK [Sulfuritortus calidifontis]|uniref:Murein L,D-transpeptidase YafK n=1 Tax=Sulfuritortus calidifontis TaxID=1914471 RepID=A0A4R3JX25_9PROT|nr:L,D-transpeptidase family protein [Sulfuritortus calidifontis]TCS72928.1 murein L,D-transpeptidase YafK [Sulfuritortus calidifontis]
MLRALLIFCAMLAWAGPAAAADRPVQLAALDGNRYLPSPDALIAKTLEAIRASRLDEALREVDRVIAIRPDFKLAHLIKGDLLLARARPLPTLGAVSKQGADQSLSDLREEARLRLLSYLDQPNPNLLPKNILQLAAGERYAILADTSRARLYLFENVDGEPRLVRDYYLTIGRNGTDKRAEGDKRTPIGVYTVTGQLPRDKLADLYGSGAFPISYPNEWDQAQGRGGHGIWLHGTPSNTYNRAPRASDGCLVLTNPDLTEIGQWLKPGTPFVITDRVEWLERERWLDQRQKLMDKLAHWKGDWENRDPEHFLKHYAPSFLQGQGKGWAEAKRRNLTDKTWIRVALSEMNLYLYAGDEMAVAEFQQDYASDKLSDATRKRLYLKQDAGDWRIVLEKAVDDAKRVAGLAR